MTRNGFIESLAEALQIPRDRAELFALQVFSTMTEAFRRGEMIEVRGFGTFSVRQYEGYKGRNPRTGESITVGPKRLVYFRPGKELRQRIQRAPTSSRDAVISDGE